MLQLLKKVAPLVCGLAVLPFLAPTLRALAPVALWEFDGDLNGSLGSPAMIATNWSPTFSTELIGGNNTQVLVVPALGSSQTLSFANPIGANGSGLRTNNFTVGWDINLRTLQTFESLLQTTPANNDDVDFFTDFGNLRPGSFQLIAATW